MFKYLLVLLLFSLIILPVNAIDTCPVCPQQTPYIVYVTVPVPVIQTPAPTPLPTPIPIPTQEPTSIINLPVNFKYIIYGILFLLLIIGIILMFYKQKKKKPKKLIMTTNLDDLYEETPESKPELESNSISEPTSEKKEKSKKPKKLKSLLDQDFEF
jgi:hypothetical protein